MVLAATLSMEALVTAVARSAFYYLWLVKQLVPHFSIYDLATAIHIMVTSNLDYCDSLCASLPLDLLWK